MGTWSMDRRIEIQVGVQRPGHRDLEGEAGLGRGGITHSGSCGPLTCQVLPHVLYVRESGLRPSDPPANTQLEATLQVLPLVRTLPLQGWDIQACFGMWP